VAIAAEHDVAWVPTDLGLNEEALHSTAAPAPRGFSVPQGQGSGVAQAYANEHGPSSPSSSSALSASVAPQELPPLPPGHAPRPQGAGGGGGTGQVPPAPHAPAPDYHSGYKDGFAAASRAQHDSNGGSGSGGGGNGMPVATVVGQVDNSHLTSNHGNHSADSSSSSGGGVVPVALPFTPGQGDGAQKATPLVEPPFRAPASATAAEEPEFPPQQLPALPPPAAPSAPGVMPLPDVPAAPPTFPQAPFVNSSAPSNAELSEHELGALRHLPPAASGASAAPAHAHDGSEPNAIGNPAGAPRKASLSLEDMEARLAGLNSTGPDNSSSSSSSSSSGSASIDGVGNSGNGGSGNSDEGGGVVPTITPEVPYPAAPGSAAGDEAPPPSDYDSLMSRFESLKT